MNEFQAAYELSRIEYVSKCEAKKAQALSDDGKIVVVTDGLVHCKFTDAVVASETFIDGVFDTIEEAEAMIAEHSDEYCDEPPYIFQTQCPVSFISDDDGGCPF